MSSRSVSPTVVRARRRCTKDVKYADLDGSNDDGFGLNSTNEPDKFEKLLNQKTFTPLQVEVLPGHCITAEWARETGLREPVMIHDREGLGLEVPPSSFTVQDVANTVGDKMMISAIEVASQAELPKWTLNDWARYYEGYTIGMPILNVISLEFSQTPLRRQVTSPQFVRDIDWIDRVWPEERKRSYQYPQVQYYCLMSLAGSYTDFHIDFGGSSVWYHVLKGKKVFYFVRPTPENLKSYEKWLCSANQENTFYGDVADVCYKVELPAGSTLMIPAGWIHAVYTPVNSLVFGGNFLHSLSMELQLTIHDLERRTHVAPKFRFPHFDEMIFYAAAHMLQLLREEQKEDDAKRQEQLQQQQLQLQQQVQKETASSEGTATEAAIVPVDAVAPEPVVSSATAASAEPTALPIEAVAAAPAALPAVATVVKPAVSVPTAATAQPAPVPAAAVSTVANDSSTSSIIADSNSSSSSGSNDAVRAGTSSGTSYYYASSGDSKEKLCVWEREGLEPLIKACTRCIANAPKEEQTNWAAAATSVACDTPSQMIAELSERAARPPPAPEVKVKISLKRPRVQPSRIDTSVADADVALDVAAAGAAVPVNGSSSSAASDMVVSDTPSAADEATAGTFGTEPTAAKVTAIPAVVGAGSSSSTGDSSDDMHVENTHSSSNNNCSSSKPAVTTAAAATATAAAAAVPAEQSLARTSSSLKIKLRLPTPTAASSSATAAGSKGSSGFDKASPRVIMSQPKQEQPQRMIKIKPPSRSASPRDSLLSPRGTAGAGAWHAIGSTPRAQQPQPQQQQQKPAATTLQELGLGDSSSDDDDYMKQPSAAAATSSIAAGVKIGCNSADYYDAEVERVVEGGRSRSSNSGRRGSSSSAPAKPLTAKEREKQQRLKQLAKQCAGYAGADSEDEQEWQPSSAKAAPSHAAAHGSSSGSIDAAAAGGGTSSRKRSRRAHSSSGGGTSSDADDVSSDDGHVSSDDAGGLSDSSSSRRQQRRSAYATGSDDDSSSGLTYKPRPSQRRSRPIAAVAQLLPEAAAYAASRSSSTQQQPSMNLGKYKIAPKSKVQPPAATAGRKKLSAKDKLAKKFKI